MKVVSVLSTLAALVHFTTALTLDPQDANSILTTSGTLAYGLMAFYKNNATGTDPTKVGTLPDPLYWWEAGAVWGGMIDYWAYTGDTSYVATVQQALLAQTGPHDNFMPPAYFFSLGNDDQAFWIIAALTAAEYSFPVPAGNASTLWLDLAAAGFNTMIPRWNTSACNGGLAWQIFPDNPNGMNYKNAISNGGMFQIAARLGRFTGNQTYFDWADKIYGWMEGVKLVGQNFDVWDGTGAAGNCTIVNKQSWSYNPSMMLYGAATMFNATNGESIWRDRTTGFLKACANTFFSPYPNATDIAFERTCETRGTCNNDQYSFKAYLSRWLGQSAVVAPFIHDEVAQLLNASAVAAAQTCTGGNSGELCGQKWYVGGFDGRSGVGQQLSVLETVQSLLVIEGGALKGVPGTAVGASGGVTGNGTISSPPSSSTTPSATTGLGQQPQGDVVTVVRTTTVMVEPTAHR